ncbi:MULTISPECIES: phosphate signaling complex protein PhoU [Congzhengia]|jgi:phosphate transport system protein|uniref:Phosphate-specific transport system accessory protein PhoU n=1 Tax=Congzhengia minquanensis TaxID=2763657 RepID=A0A926DJK1_9FIRM|nr:phosphate signaling complex protein PhoU [Congzhengia minquanensis]MBC8539401.1 phosphate signaling complex protein PhoU [Congzhengia minquanensis]MBD8946412.1 phosphate signaling complex protein PhoU [Clostridiales bacterium]
MRIKFDEQLEILNNELTEMGFLVEKAITSAVDALRKNDKDLAQQAIAFDSEIDQKEKDIEAICLRLLLHQQPVATDLRKVSSALKMITDMERIGDMASDISEITMMDSELLAVSNLEHISQMEKETIQMVNESIKAFVKKDIQLAQKVIDDDDIVDALFEKVKSDLIEIMRTDVSVCNGAVDLLMVAKYFERIGDHATNIAEWVLFSIEGTHVE